MSLLSRLRGLTGLETLCLVALVFFILIIFLPPIYILTYSLTASFSLDASGKAALVNSFIIAACVTLVDFVFGLPVAWVMARRGEMKFRHFIDTLIDMPLVVPTSVLGLSVFYFWGEGLGRLFGAPSGLISKGPILIALLHIAFTFPYVVRSIEAAIVQINRSHEQAATMLGASAFTVFRTISTPLFKAGLVSGAILAFTRSLSETGATMMVAGLFQTAPTIVVAYKKAGDIPSAAAVSIILIFAAVILLLIAKIFSAKFKIPIIHVWPNEERSISRRYVRLRDVVVSAAVLILILLPTFYIVLSGLGVIHREAFMSLINDRDLIYSIVISFVIGFIITVVNLAVAIPLGILISKNVFRIGVLVDTMSDMVLLVPTSALGLSLGLFWKNFSFGEFPILLLAHISFTFPLMVKPIAAAMGGVDPSLEAAARTLKAKPLTVFRTVVYPLIKPGIIAGIIMTFMRSLSETGATLAVSENIKTIPVLLVDLFAKGQVDDKTTLACIILFLMSFAFIIVLKKKGASNHAVH
jgi:thiamine transport system permease protein